MWYVKTISFMTHFLIVILLGWRLMELGTSEQSSLGEY